MQRRILQGLLILTVLATAGKAFAQAEALQDPIGMGGLSMGIQQPLGYGGLNINTNPEMVSSPGVKLSESFLLHAGVSVGAGVDTNVFYRDGNQQSAAMSRVLPHLVLTNVGRGATPNIVFTGTVGADYRQYFSDSQAVKNQGTAIGVAAKMGVDIGALSKWTFSVFGRVARDVQASYIPGTSQFERIVAQPGARLRWRPGGGRWEQTLTYSVMFDHFENATLSSANAINHWINFRSSFRFLPKTALYLDVVQGIVNYTTDNVGKSNSKPLRITLGMLGMITSRLLADVYAGYGNGFYEQGPSPSFVVGGLALQYRFGAGSHTRIGYERDFNNSIYGNFYDVHAAFASFDQKIGERFVASVSGRYEHRLYKCIPGTNNAAIVCAQDANNGEDRSDNWLAVGAGAAYYPVAWMSIGAGYQLLTNLTDFTLPGVGIDNKVSFVKHQVVGTLSFTY